MIRRILFVVWCLSWLPSIGFGLAENLTGKPDSTIESAVRVGCFVNMGLFYVGGPTWLIWRSIKARTWTHVCAAWAVLIFLNPCGPVILAICNSILRDRGRVEAL